MDSKCPDETLLMCGMNLNLCILHMLEDTLLLLGTAHIMSYPNLPHCVTCLTCTVLAIRDLNRLLCQLIRVLTLYYCLFICFLFLHCTMLLYTYIICSYSIIKFGTVHYALFTKSLIKLQGQMSDVDGVN